MTRAIWVFTLMTCAYSGIIPPPWADPKVNPCAEYSWQYVFWPVDGKCYPIFRKGPCPETLELAFDIAAKRSHCKCPRGLVLWQDGRCHEPYTSGPCEPDHYLHPGVAHRELTAARKIQNIADRPLKRVPAEQDEKMLQENEDVRCLPKGRCPAGWAYWAKDGACYELYTIGPCSKGDLIMLDSQTGEPQCACDQTVLKQYYWPSTGGCYEPLSRGPCERGVVFFFNSTSSTTQCGCSPDLPNFHIEAGKCYELFTDGPCSFGQWFAPDLSERLDSEISSISEENMFELFNPDTSILFPVCQCRPEHVQWSDGACYREFTRGPCPAGTFVMDSNNGTGTCFKNPCNRGHLYYPTKKKCYKVGSRGACPDGKIFIYEDYRGVSYQGICGCSKSYSQNYLNGKCYELSKRGPCKETFAFILDKRTGKPHCACDEDEGFTLHNETQQCFKLFTQGPCSLNEWLVPEISDESDETVTHASPGRMVKCHCRPGFRPDTEGCKASPAAILSELARDKRKGNPEGYYIYQGLQR